MFDASPTIEMLARAIDVCALRQAVYSANIANANVTGYHRMAVQFDDLAMRAEVVANSAFGSARSKAPASNLPEIVDTQSAVKLDEEMAAMAQNALRYQTLLGAYERSLGMVRMAIREGREV